MENKKKLNLNQKLLKIQTELKAPKTQFNKFGNFSYRSAEDILEAVKPLLNKYDVTLLLSDSIILISNRYYVQATAKLIDIENTQDIIEVTAYAREEEEKKGMDGSQITGASSSYARKYALNGLFLIDDTKDSDYTNTYNTEKPTKASNNEKKDIYKEQFEILKAKIEKKQFKPTQDNIDKVFNFFKNSQYYAQTQKLILQLVEEEQKQEEQKQQENNK